MSRPATTYHSVKGFIKRDTDKALLMEVTTVGTVELDAEDVKSHWFPVSQISKIFRQPKNSQEPDEIHVAQWILASKGLA